MVAGQAGNTRLAGLVFIKSFNRSVDKTEVRHHRFTRALGVTVQNGVHHCLVLFRQL